MKVAGIFRFEMAYQLRRPWPWLALAAVLLFAFFFTRAGVVGDALYEDLHLNSSFMVVGVTMFSCLIWLLVGAPIAGEAGARDIATRMHPLAYTMPVTRGEYLGGRFLAAFVLNALILLGAEVGNILALYLPGIPAETLGPFRPAAYLSVYAVLLVPNAFIAVSVQFALATLTGRAMASYLGSVIMFFMAWILGSLILWSHPELGKLLDPIGVTTFFREMGPMWTSVEKNTRLVTPTGTLLWNRLLWLTIAGVTLVLTHLRFRFAHRVEGSWWPLTRGRRAAAEPTAALTRRQDVHARVAIPVVERSFGVAAQVRQTLAIAGSSFRSMARSWTGLGVLALLPLMAMVIVLDQMTAMGALLVPRTARVLHELVGPLSDEMSRWVIIPLVIVYFAGELVWRERDAGVNELTDAMPGSDWPALLGKILGLGLLLVVLMALLAGAGVAAQTISGYHHYELGLYLKVLFGLQLTEYLLFAVLAVVIHVIVDQKYVGHLLAIMAYVFIALLAGFLGIEHKLLVYATGPGWSYTEMSGFAGSVGPWLWLKLYWAAWAMLVAVAARLLWVRGRERRIGSRLRTARRRLRGPTSRAAVVAAGLVMALGGFVFYNTNILNEYVGRDAVADRRAEYERRYQRYENVAQPRLTAAGFRVDFFPRRRAADVRGTYRLVNATSKRIDSIHVATAVGGVETKSITFDRPATAVVIDERHGYRIYALATPLEPGATLQLDFTIAVARHGFSNRGVDPSITERGSAFNGADWFPLIGYQRQRELISAGERRRHRLEARPIVASLYDEEASLPSTRGGGVSFTAVVGTDSDQIGVAPGAARRSWSEGERRYVEYASDAPIGTDWAFFSGRYAIYERQWKDVAIRIYHDPAHTDYLERTMSAVTASLDFNSRELGPYPYRHLTIVEHPGRSGNGLHAESSIIVHGQGFAFWAPRDTSSLDFPYAATAHEMAHQWTLPYAFVEGAPFLSEGLAWYTAMQVLEASRGSEQLHRLTASMRQPSPYPPIRRGEPLLRALDPYLSYRRGPFSMYAMREYIGADRVNGAISKLIEIHDRPGASRVTTLDLYRELQSATPDTLKVLLHDLFEVNTLWMFGTKNATAVRTGPSEWQVTIDVSSEKIVYDGAGVETKLPMDQWVPVGVFAEPAAGHDRTSAPLHMGMYRLHAGQQTVTVTVSRKPAFAGVDPYHILDWEVKESDDNTVAVAVGAKR